MAHRPWLASSIVLIASAALLPHIALAQVQLAPSTNYDGQDLSGGNYSGQNGSSSSFINTNLNSASLIGTNLTGAVLTNADFTNADLTNASIGYADLSHSNISEAQLRSATNTQYFVLKGTDLTGYNLSYRDLTGANLSGSNLTSGNLNHSVLTYSNLSGATLDGANLQNTFLLQTNLAQASLQNANLSNMAASTTSFLSANLQYANLSHATLYNDNFSGANLSYADLSYTNLSTSNLTSANLNGANLNGAKLAASMPLLPVISGATVTVDQGSKVTAVNGSYVSSGGTLVINGTLSTPDLQAGGAIQLGDNGNLIYTGPLNGEIDIISGSLSGTGTVTGDVYNSNGAISPESSTGTPGNLKISGNLGMNASTFFVDIASPTSYSTLTVSGTTSLFGKNQVSVDFLDGYTPSYGDTFDILMFNGGLSSFAGSLTLPDDWQLSGNATTLTMRYVGTSTVSATAPEPGSFALLGISALPLIYVLRRRNRKGTI